MRKIDHTLAELLGVNPFNNPLMAFEIGIRNSDGFSQVKITPLF
jgi:hypothetical protein